MVTYEVSIAADRSLWPLSALFYDDLCSCLRVRSGGVWFPGVVRSRCGAAAVVCGLSCSRCRGGGCCVACCVGALRRCCGWCRSSSPCWSGRSGTVGLYSMGKLRFRCCVTRRRLPGFGGILDLIFYLTGTCWFSRLHTWLRWGVSARLRAAVSADARRSVGSTL